MSRPGMRTDERLSTWTSPTAITAALRTADPARQLLISARSPAAMQAAGPACGPDRVSFLAEIVRRGGIEYAAGLPEPMPTPEQGAVSPSGCAGARRRSALRRLARRRRGDHRGSRSADRDVHVTVRERPWE